ncbi:MAG: NADPH:quinone oxidoreductase family protein [Nevskiaceae bacterium]|nr:MAG: NADPH:quinone oxidoreductase family protein [Nevskiaceae bacterium]TBR73593.1 MAG: NADPH:quinone oxidoreductase family protein [Nevskiaceae bacterium]
MKAVVCKELGPPEKLVVETVPDPQAGAGQVRVRIASAGINFPDTLQIEGRYQMKLDPPFTPGAEIAGTVVEVGTGVTDRKVGDRVAAFIPCGGYAEQAVVPAVMTLPIPPQLDLKDAGGFPLVHGTVLYALKQRGALQPGETLLVLGASGGVGLAAVQLGKLLGARVIAAASTAEKRQACLDHGADEVVDYATLSLKDEVKRLTRKRGADVIFDPVGDRWARDCLSCLAWKGRWLIVGFAGGKIPEIPVNLLLLKGAAAVGVFWGSFAQREPSVNAENFAQLFRWLADGSLKPVISKHYPLDQAPQALRDMLERRVVGKVVLTP